MTGDFGYNNKIKTIDCRMSEPIINKIKINNDKFKDEDIGGLLSIGTYNVWGVEKFTYSLLEERVKHIIKIITDNNIDIWCLQEVGPFVYDKLVENDIVTERYAFSWDKKDIDWKEQNIAVLILSKILPKNGNSIKHILIGEQKYDCNILEFDYLVICSVHLQAGSSNSPGIEKGMEGKYSKCRTDMMDQVISTLNGYKKDIVLTGDFNMDLDGESSKWPEINTLRKYHFNDTWRTIHPTKAGFTEDTDINKMRWNVKHKVKRVRYDTILYKGNIKARDIEMVGIDKVFEVKSSFLEKHIDKLGLKKDSMITNNKGNLDWWPSDHFGLVCQLFIDSKN